MPLWHCCLIGYLPAAIFMAISLITAPDTEYPAEEGNYTANEIWKDIYGLDML